MCNLEFPDLQLMYKEYSDQGFIILGVNTGGLGGMETEDHVRRFLEQTKVSFPVAWDDHSKDDFAWPPALSPFPRQALLGRDGTIRYLASEHIHEQLLRAVELALAE